MAISILVEDHVVPLLFTSAIEAYEVAERRKQLGPVETYGLLWGYALPAREETGQPERLIAVTATIETSAQRAPGSVAPKGDSIVMKRDFIRKYWPHLELIGTFHSHPYEGLSEVNGIQGWRCSDEDREHWLWFHETFCDEMPSLAHLIVTISKLEKQGTAWPSRLSGNEAGTGYVLNADRRKLWIRGYVSERFGGDDSSCGDYSFEVDKDVVLDIPALTTRFGAW